MGMVWISSRVEASTQQACWTSSHQISIAKASDLRAFDSAFHNCLNNLWTFASQIDNLG